jgi:recombination protein RecA
LSERKKPGPKPGTKKKTSGKKVAKKATGAKRGPKPKVTIGYTVSEAENLALDGPRKKSVATTPGLSAVLDSLNGKYGAGTIRRANSTEPIIIDRISTGHIDIDRVTGGGIPRGRITEIYGPESSGKTTLATQITANAQAMGLVAALEDTEHATDFEYNELLGVNMDDLLLSQPNSAEETLDILSSLVKSKEVGLIIVDSTAAMPTKRELEGEATDEHVAELARIMSKELRKLTALIADSNTAVVFISQLREKIGFNPTGQEMTQSTGGRALKFYASLRLDIRKAGQITITTAGDKFVSGQKTKIKTAKNKVGPALRTIEVELRYPTDLGKGVIQTPGFDGISALINASVEAGHMVGGGSKSFVFPDGTSIRGSQNARDYLAQTPELIKQLKEQLAS